MSHEYAMSRVRDALEKADGNHPKALKLILSLLEKDQTLLAGLVAPHLHGIIAHALMNAARPQSKPLPKHVDLPPETKGGSLGSAAYQQSKGNKSGTVQFGDNAGEGNVAPPGKASKAHVDAINLLVKAGAKKKTKED